MIAETHREIEAAKKVLEAVEKKGTATKAEIDKFASQLQTSARQLKGTTQAETEARKKLEKIETAILEREGDDSEYAKKIDEIDDVQLRLEQEFHRILKRPENLKADEDIDQHRLLELASVTPEERAKLKRDAKYAEAEDHLIKACHDLTSIEHGLFLKDKEWKAANAARTAAHEDRQQDATDTRRNGMAASQAKRELKSLASLAAEARSVIAAGEARLRQLGASGR